MFSCDWEVERRGSGLEFSVLDDFTNTCNTYGLHGEDYNSEDISAIPHPPPANLPRHKNL